MQTVPSSLHAKDCSVVIRRLIWIPVSRRPLRQVSSCQRQTLRRLLQPSWTEAYLFLQIGETISRRGSSYQKSDRVSACSLLKENPKLFRTVQSFEIHVYLISSWSAPRRQSKLQVSLFPKFLCKQRRSPQVSSTQHHSHPWAQSNLLDPSMRLYTSWVLAIRLQSSLQSNLLEAAQAHSRSKDRLGLVSSIAYFFRLSHLPTASTWP